jgi:hypothetical protein
MRAGFYMEKLVFLAVFLVFLLVFLVVAGAACASRQPGNSGAIGGTSPRPAGCSLTMLHAPAPNVADWDDLGVAEVTCHIDVGLTQCLRLFRAEACRMGADIVYDLPEKPLRPREQAVLYRGRVAHTRPRGPVPSPQ